MSLNWQPARRPEGRTLQGRFVRLERLDPVAHADALWAALQSPGGDPRLWDYLGYGPFAQRADFDAWLQTIAASQDPLFHTIIGLDTQQPQGLITLMSIEPAHGRIEIGNVVFGAGMQRSPKSTEAIYLLACESFELGNRRLEWKCDNGNARSKRSAERLGFTFEGVFRQHMVIKGRNRDTAWFSITDLEWPRVREAFERWLGVDNLVDGKQMQSLEAIRSGE